MNILALRVVKRAVDALAAEGRSLDAVECFDGLRELHELGENVLRLPGGLHRVARPPVSCGNLTFAPPTLAAIEWQGMAARWFAGDADLCGQSVAFALCTPPRELWKLQTPKAALAAIHAWALTAGATPEAINAASSLASLRIRLMPPPPGSGEPGSAALLRPAQRSTPHPASSPGERYRRG